MRPSFITDLKISWRNLGRNKNRTFLAWTGIAVAQFTLLWLTSFMNGYESLIFQKLTGPMLGHIQIHAPLYRDENAIERTIPKATQKLELLRGIPHIIQISPRIYGPVLATVQELGHVAMVTGVNLHNELGPSGLFEGLSFPELPNSKEALIGKGLALEMGVHPQDTLALMGQALDGSLANDLYQVKTIVSSDLEQINRAGIIMNLESAQDFLGMPDQVHELAIRVDQSKNIPFVLNFLRQTPGLSGLEILDWKELVPQISAFLEMADSINLVILVLVFLTTSAGIANTMLMATFERSHEFGMLLALGCKPSRLIRILFLEAIILGVSGVLIGSLFGSLIVTYQTHHGISLKGFGGQNGISFTMEGLEFGTKLYPILKSGDLLRSIIAIIITSCLASVWPARRISRIEPVEAMRT